MYLMGSISGLRNCRGIQTPACDRGLVYGGSGVEGGVERGAHRLRERFVYWNHVGIMLLSPDPVCVCVCTHDIAMYMGTIRTRSFLFYDD